MKKYSLPMMAAICILLLAAPVAMADLINPTLGIGNNEDAAFFDPLVPGDDPVVLISKVETNEDGGEIREGVLPNELIVDPANPYDQQDAYVSWDLTGDGYIVKYVVVKDGSTVGTGSDGNPTHWIYYTVTQGQWITSNGPQYVSTAEFNDSAGNISHISMYGVSVPEPGILILLGIAMSAVGIGSRFVRKI